MQNIIKNAQNYSRFARCSVAIQILICLILLIVLIKQAINFYNKNYTPYIILNQADKKYEQNTQMMLQNQNLSRKPQIVLQPSSPKQQAVPRSMVSSKAPLQHPQPIKIQIQLDPTVPKIPHNNNNINNTSQQNAIKNNQNKPQNIQTSKSVPKIYTKSQISLKQTKAQKQKQAQKLKFTNSITFMINLSIQKLLIKLTFFGIMVINIVMLVSYQYLVCMAFIYVVVVVVGEMVKEKWWKIGIILDIVSAGLIIAGFINAYVTKRVPNS